MSTDPGDLVLDPTCGSGTTAYIAEQWGRRWITIDTSRVALALARARIMGARYPYYLLADSPEGQRKEGEASRTPPKETPTRGDIRQGFVYERVPHITLKSIANNAEIDVIWEKWQETLEPLRARLKSALGRGPHLPVAIATGPSLSRSAGEGLAAASDKPLARIAGEGAACSAAGEGKAAWEEWEIPREVGRIGRTTQNRRTPNGGRRGLRGRRRSMPRSRPGPSSNISTTSPTPTIRASASPAHSRSRACRRTALSPWTSTTA